MNNTLTQIQQGIEAKVTPENKAAYRKVVTAGLKIMFDEKTHAHMELVKNPASRNAPVETIAAGVAGLSWLMFMQSKKTMKPEVMIMAGVTLMAHAIDFAERGLGIQFSNEMIAKTTKLLAEHLFTKMGISPEQLQQAIAKGSKEIDDYKAQQQPQSGMLQAGQPGAA